MTRAMEIGKLYKVVNEVMKCKECGQKIEAVHRGFPFGEKYGMYMGIVNSGFLWFKLSKGREGLMNGGNYEKVDGAIKIEFEVKGGL